MHTQTSYPLRMSIGAGLLFASAAIPAVAASAPPVPWLWPWLSGLPDWAPSAALATLFIGLGWLTLAILSRRRPAANPRAGCYVTFGATLAGILLGVLVAGPWQTFLINMQPPTSAGYAPPTLLDEPIKGDVKGGPTRPAKVKGDRARHARVKLEALQAPALALNLFGDTVLTAIRDREIQDADGSVSWIGHVDGYDNSQVVLSAHGRALMGTVTIDGRSFEIVYAGGNTHAVRELDPNRLPPQYEPPRPPPSAPTAQDPDTASVAANITDTGMATATASLGGTADPDDNIIDLMVLYTPRTVTNAGGVEAIEAKIKNAVDQANAAYDNSGVHMFLNTVYKGQVNYTENGSLEAARARLVNQSDGYMDEVAQLREQYSADQVVLVVADSNFCGMADLMTINSTAAAAQAFVVVHDDSVYPCLSTNNILAHELGHAQGNAHNIEVSPGPGVFPESHGYVDCGVARDIMAYPCNGEQPYALFSKPFYDALNLPLGNDAANTVDSMNQTAPTVAAFRIPPTTAPVAATGLNVTATASSTIPGAFDLTVTWTDNATNEVGYKLQSSQDGATWYEIVTLGPNAASYVDRGLANNKTYSYRVKAYNGIGVSPDSSVAAITLGDPTPPTVTITNPANGASIAATATAVTIRATASDNIKLVSMKLYIDGVLTTGTTVTFSPTPANATSGTLTYSWSVRRIAAGTHTIRVDAQDNVGNLATASRTVTKL